MLDICFTENNGLDGIVHCDNCNSFAVLTGRIEKLKQVSQLDSHKIHAPLKLQLKLKIQIHHSIIESKLHYFKWT